MMNFREFYEKKGVDYDAFLERLMGKETLVEKYIGIFMGDSTFAELEQAMEVQNYETVGFKAHTLKGVALNLNFDRLALLCMNLVNSIRNGNVDEVKPQFEEVKSEYTGIMKELEN